MKLGCVSFSMEKKVMMLDRECISKVVQGYEGFVFSELDKNVNSWSIVCKRNYVESLRKNFRCDSVHYTRCMKDKEIIEKEIVRDYNIKFGNMCVGARK